MANGPDHREQCLCEYQRDQLEYTAPELFRHGWTLLIKMAEVTLIAYSYLNRLSLSTSTEVGPSFQIKIQGWGQSEKAQKLSILQYARSICVTSAIFN